MSRKPCVGIPVKYLKPGAWLRCIDAGSEGQGGPLEHGRIYTLKKFEDVGPDDTAPLLSLTEFDATFWFAPCRFEDGS